MIRINLPLRRRCLKRVPTATPRKGAALVEIIVAMVILVVSALGLAAMTTHATRRSSVLVATGGRTATQIQVLDQLMVIPFNLLPSKEGCTTVSRPPYPHTRCVDVEDVAFRHRRVTVRFTPSNSRFKADTIVFERSKGVPSSPLSS